ncbi:MAG TPA: glycosyltransferase [Candidatus Hydrogenedentes bacterium]|nr:glycosyltransferase [Candidatus Hydrogenedentota bacterium]
MIEPVNIIIPAWNQVAYTRQCLQTLADHTPPDTYRLILVDNGSTDGTAELFDAMPGAEVIHFPENRGFAAAVNAGIHRARPGHVLLLNNDTLLPPGWLERLRIALEETPDAGMAGPVSNNVSGSQQIDTPPLASFEEMVAFAESRARAFAGRRRETARLVGFCLLIRDQVIRDVGLFDERYGIGNFEDDDYSLRVLRAGWRLIIAEDAFVFHYGGRTFAAMDPDAETYRQLLARNEALFMAKFRPQPQERLEEALRARRLAESAARLLAEGHLKQAIETGLEALRLWRADPLALEVLAGATEQLGDARRAALLRQQAEAARQALEASPTGFPDTEAEDHDGTG